MVSNHVDYARGDGPGSENGLAAILTYAGLFLALLPVSCIFLAFNEAFAPAIGILTTMLSPLSPMVGLACAILSRPTQSRTKRLRSVVIAMSAASAVGCVASIWYLFSHMPG